MNAYYRASLVNRHIRRFTGFYISEHIGYFFSDCECGFINDPSVSVGKLWGLDLQQGWIDTMYMYM